MSTKLLLLLLSAYYTQASRSTGCGNPLPQGIHAGHSSWFWIQVDDPVMGLVDRNYRLHVPWNYDINNPAPLVVDFHGWGGDAHSQEKDSHLAAVADMDMGGFFVASLDGMRDNDAPGRTWGSFNCSRSSGSLGPTCDTDRQRYGEIPCYASCPNCNQENSCDWTSCHDDIAFTRQLVEELFSTFCVETTSVHQTGISNGGMFSYFMASQLSDLFASIAPVAGAPLIGFGDLPPTPMSLLDFHGIADDTIPYDLEHSEGEGPHQSVISWDGFYYEQKQSVIQKWVDGMNCNTTPEIWMTEMDGVDDWQCWSWTGCTNNVQVVSCTANYGHDYPFGSSGQYVEGAKIMWNFMKQNHRNLNTVIN